MQSYSLKHLKDQPLLDGLDDSFVRCYANAATRLAHVAEVDARQLYRQSGYPSMTAYCMGRFRVSKDSAYKLVRAAQLAYEYPVLFEAVADGRLQTRGIVLLGPRLTPKTPSLRGTGPSARRGSSSTASAWRCTGTRFSTTARSTVESARSGAHGRRGTSPVVSVTRRRCPRSTTPRWRRSGRSWRGSHAVVTTAAFTSRA